MLPAPDRPLATRFALRFNRAACVASQPASNRLPANHVCHATGLRARIKQVIVSTFGEEPWNSCRRWVGDALLADAAAQSEPTPATFDERLWLQRARVTTSTPLLTGYIAELLQKLRRAERVGVAASSVGQILADRDLETYRRRTPKVCRQPTMYGTDSRFPSSCLP